MAITFVGRELNDQAGALSLTLTIHANATANDFMVAFVKQSENTTGREWDDDGGGGNGWIRLAYNRTTSGRDQETAVYWKIHDGSEANPTFTWASGITNEPMSGTLAVYRGTDLTDPIQDWGYIAATNDANPPNPNVTVSSTPATHIVFHAATHDDISAVAAPTGYALRSQVWSGTANDHRNHFVADLIGDNTLGSYTPPDWQHSVLNTTPEYHTYTISLQEPVLIALTDFDTNEKFTWNDNDKILTGFGFEASQGTGKVEIWSDQTGTVKTTQTIDSWNDTSIQIDTVQGALASNAILYIVVTNDSGDVSSPFEINEGLLPYTTALLALSPDHYWKLNNVYDDTGITGPVRNMTSGVIGTHSFSSTPIAEDTTHAWRLNDVLDRREISDSPNMNITINSAERTFGGWVMLGGIQQSLGAIWKEGGGVQNLAFIVGLGNVLMAQLADVAASRDNVQAFSDIKLTPNRPYHIIMRYSHSEATKEFRLYLDGEEQTVTDGNPMTIGTFDSHSGDVTFGDPDNNLETGGTDIAYAGQEDCELSHWATWSDNSANNGALDKITEIRDVLFRRGALPDSTISTGTESTMQTALDALANTEIPDWPLGIRIGPVTGGGDFELVADNITFNPRATMQIEYQGSDTLTWVNTNGTAVNSAKFFTPNGGTIAVVNTVTVKVTVLDIETRLPVVGARVRIVADTGGDLSAGHVIIEGLSNASGVLETTSFRYTNNQPITGRIRKGSESIYYKTQPVTSVITESGSDLVLLMIRDE